MRISKLVYHSQAKTKIEFLKGCFFMGVLKERDTHRHGK